MLAWGGEAFVTGFLHHGHQVVEVVVDVEQRDGFLVDVELAPGQHGRELFEGTEAPGKNDKGVGLTQHFVLTFVHRAGLNQACYVHLGKAHLLEEGGDDADDFTAGGHGRFGDGAH